ncbi:hypothetical protein BS78_03G077400 [Paspalum vaginatum]|nr:hypothetical protein BS78_03G077400 [Paspalum vaginatum]
MRPHPVARFRRDPAPSRRRGRKLRAAKKGRCPRLPRWRYLTRSHIPMTPYDIPSATRHGGWREWLSYSRTGRAGGQDAPASRLCFSLFFFPLSVAPALLPPAVRSVFSLFCFGFPQSARHRTVQTRVLAWCCCDACISNSACTGGGVECGVGSGLATSHRDRSGVLDGGHASTRRAQIGVTLVTW